jgi:tetratricopeptide (TPR) repeat protein
LLPAAVALLVSLYPWNEGFEIQAANQYYNIGNRYYEWKMYENALQSYQRALPALDWRWQLHFNTGNTHRRLHDYRSAAESYQRVLKKNPKFKRARQRLKEMRELMKKTGERERAAEGAGG